MIDFSQMSPAEAQLARAQLAPLCGYQRVGDCLEQPKPNKYRAQRTEYGGIVYDSKAEAEHAVYLDSDRYVHWWLRQVVIPLGPDFKTRVDFLVCYLTSVRAHEVKGAETREFKKVRQLWPKYGPFPLRVIKPGNVEVIEGKP